MSAPAHAAPGGRILLIRGRPYPVLLPSPRDPRLHLASVIVSLQILGQTAFDFRLSIAQILVSLGTCAVLESGIAFARRRVIMWPASALLTGNGVAFVLRVPGTEHGDWWSLDGWWIFAGTAAVALLSKHVIRVRGQHVFNPSNIGLVLCFLVLGSSRAEPLDFWWSPMTAWMALALALIVAGGLAILARLRLLTIALGFWLSFAAGIGVLAASGHAMTARWHLGPITGPYFWWVLVTSPEILVFLFFMITDPKTSPAGRWPRLAYAVSIGLIASLLIAPQRTEYASKVAVLGALAIVCAARAVLPLLPLRVPLPGPRRLAGAALLGTAALAGAIVAAGIPARPAASVAAPAASAAALPPITILPSRGVESKLDPATARRIAGAVVTSLREQSRRRVLAAAGRPLAVPSYRLDRMTVWLERGEGQGPPVAVVRCAGTRLLATWAGSPAQVVDRGEATPFEDTLRLTLRDGRFVLAPGTTLLPAAPVRTSPRVERAAAVAFRGVRLTDVAKRVGLRFRQGSFRFGVTPDAPAMMGGGLCWLDYDGDGWLDLFVVNNYADSDIGAWDRRGGLPTSALFHNVHGRFVNVTARAGAGLAVRGQGCVAADLNGDGHTDLFVSTASDDKLLWNDGDGTFTEGARSSGVVSFGWHSGAAVGDVNGDGRPDLYVAGYTEDRAPIPGSMAGYPTNHLGVRDLLFLNEGNGPNGRARFREVGRQAGIDSAPYDHSLGAVFTDLNGDGRLDLYVANDEDPNRYYVNVASSGLRGRGLGFRFVDRAPGAGLADRNAGMGIAAGDFSDDGRPDLLVSNSRGQEHAVFTSRGGSFANGKAAFAAAFGTNFTGWGASWVDLGNDGQLDLVLANGAIPVTNLARDAGPVQVLGSVQGQFANVTGLVGLRGRGGTNGRGVAAADFDNDGQVDVAINSVGGGLLLLRATGGTGHWLEVGLPRFAPGAVVTAVLPDGRRLVRDVLAGSSYLSSEDPRVHFGLGDARSVRELIVRYPDGHTARRAGVPADRIVSVRP